MRSLLAAVVVLALSIALLARPVSAEAPPPMERREVGPILAALKKKPALKASLATLRFYVEVAGGSSLEIPVGSPAEATDGVLGEAEQALLHAASCRTVSPAELKAATALVAEYADALPVTLRAWTLAQQGKKTQAADLLAAVIDQQLPEGAKCPSEHPNNSFARSGRISRVLDCLQAVAPARDVTKQKKVLQRAEKCANENTAEG